MSVVAPDWHPGQQMSTRHVPQTAGLPSPAHVLARPLTQQQQQRSSSAERLTSCESLPCSAPLHGVLAVAAPPLNGRPRYILVVFGLHES